MYEPKPEHKFTFGLWTVGNVGRGLRRGATGGDWRRRLSRR